MVSAPHSGAKRKFVPNTEPLFALTFAGAELPARHVRLASEMRRTQRLAPRGRRTGLKLPDIAHQTRETPFPRLIPRRLCRLPWTSLIHATHLPDRIDNSGRHTAAGLPGCEAKYTSARSFAAMAWSMSLCFIIVLLPKDSQLASGLVV